jgi:hypothetical protein
MALKVIYMSAVSKGRLQELIVILRSKVILSSEQLLFREGASVTAEGQKSSSEKNIVVERVHPSHLVTLHCISNCSCFYIGLCENRSRLMNCNLMAWVIKSSTYDIHKYKRS